jgi:hypothetical protein
VSALKVLRLLQGGAFGDILRVKIGSALAQEIEFHLRAYVIHVLERDVRSAAFIDRLRREGGGASGSIGLEGRRTMPLYEYYCDRAI